MTIKLQDLYAGNSMRGRGNPLTKSDDNSLLTYLVQRRNTNQLNLEVLHAHEDNLRDYEQRRIDWLRKDTADCDKAICMLTGNFN